MYMFRNKKKISSLLSGVMFLSLLFPTGLSASSANPAASPSVIDMRQTLPCITPPILAHMAANNPQAEMEESGNGRYENYRCRRS